MKQRSTRTDRRPRRGLSLALLIALVAVPPAAAQETLPNGTGDEAAEAAEPAAKPGPDQLHDELRALRATMESALNERDLDALVGHVTDDVVFVTMNNDVVRGPDGIRDYFRKMLEGESRVVDTVTSHFEPLALSVLIGDDVAIAYGRSDDHYRLRGGRELTIDGRWSATMVRRDGRWLVAAFHYSTNVFDNPVLATQRRVLSWIAAGIGAVLLIVGLLIGRGLGRRPPG
jgi:uncharacterized protein (TIGR02246 family)